MLTFSHILHQFLKLSTSVNQYVTIYYGDLQFSATKRIRRFYIKIKDILLFSLRVIHRNHSLPRNRGNKINYYMIFNVLVMPILYGRNE